MPNQVGIFNEAEVEQDPKAPEPTEEKILVPAHTASRSGRWMSWLPVFR